MARSSIFSFTLLLIALLCSPCALRANPAPFPIAGGTVAAKSPHETIRMDAEDVTIRMGKGRTYMVDAVYLMFNTGDETTEWVGFPRGVEYDSEMELPQFVQFHAWVDGRKVPFTKEGKQWLAGRVTFPGHTRTVIRVMYEANYSEQFLYRGIRYADYIVGTGSLWKDNIGTAIFTVDASAIGGTGSLYADIKAPHCRKLRTEQVLRFEVRDFKPERDATLRIEFGGPIRALAQ